MGISWVTWIGGTDGSSEWSSPSNWEGGALPQKYNGVTLNDGAKIELTETETVAGISVSGTVTVNGNGYALSNSNGDLTLKPGANLVLAGVDLTTQTLTSSSASTLTLSGSSIKIQYGNTIPSNVTVNFQNNPDNYGNIPNSSIFLTYYGQENSSSAKITNFSPSDRIVINFSNKNNVVSDVHLVENLDRTTYSIVGTQYDSTVTIFGNVTLEEGVSVNDFTYTKNDDGSYIFACFLSGSMISTPDGDVAVEDINIGDEITTFDWKSGQDIVRPVVWVGKAHVNVRHGVSDDMSGFPIRVLKDAIADGVPYKDMLVTAEHSLFFDGKFVPARMLVNGRSIFYDKSITSYDYYHVETEQHSVITADGMLTESYLDTGNRHTFRQEGSVVAFTPSRNLTWDDAAAPLGVSREFAEPLFRQAEARAEAAGIAQKESALELTDDVNLHLVTDTGAVIRQAREHNGSVVFMLPTGVRSVRIVSNASRPSDVIGPFVDDRRYFGVAVGDITLFEAGRNHAVTAHLTEKELDGWNTLEWEDTRWTSGNALLPLGERHPNSVALLAIQIKKAGPYLASDGADIKSVKTA
nr:Hint domain-containing protein [Gluconobacter oxydans]